MKRASSVLVLVAVALVMVLAPMAWAAEVQGKIKSVDPSGRMVVLDDGTQPVIPPTLTVERQALQPGANVKASYDEQSGQKVATSFTVTSADRIRRRPDVLDSRPEARDKGSHAAPKPGA